MHMNKHNEGLHGRKIVGRGGERGGGMNEKPIDVLSLSGGSSTGCELTAAAILGLTRCITMHSLV